jgi:hypothetical protein
LQRALVVVPHSEPRWVYERAIYTAAPVTYGELVIYITGDTNAFGASVSGG